MAFRLRTESLLTALVTICACGGGPPGQLATQVPQGQATTPSSASTSATPDTDPMATGTLPPPAVYVSPCSGPAPALVPIAARQVIQGAHSEQLSAMAVSPQGYLATASYADKSVRLWDLRSRALLRVLRPARAPSRVAWDATGTKIVLDTIPNNTVIDLEGSIADQPQAKAVQFLQSTSGVLADGLAQDFRSGAFLFDHPRFGSVQLRVAGAGAFAQLEDVRVSDDRGVVTARVNQGAGILIWLVTGPTADARLVPVGGELRAYTLTPKGDALVAVVNDTPRETQPTPHFYVLSTLSKTAKAQAFTSPDPIGVSALAFSPDGSQLAVAGFNSLSMWEYPSMRRRWRVDSEVFDAVKQAASGSGFDKVAFSPVGNVVVAARANGALALYDRTSGRSRGDLGARVRAPREATFVDDDVLAVRTRSNVVVWSTSRGEPLQQMPLDYLGALAVAPGRDLVSVRVAPCTGRGELRLLLDGWTGITPPREMASWVDKEIHVCQDQMTRVPAPTFPPRPGVALDYAGYKSVDAVTAIDVVRGTAFTQTFGPSGVVESLLDLRRGAMVPIDTAAFVATERQSLDGGVLTRATQSKDNHGGIGVWDPATGKLLVNVVFDRQGVGYFFPDAWGVAADGKSLVVASGKRVGVRALPAGSAVVDFECRAPATAAALAGGPDDVLVGAVDGSLGVYHAGTLTGSSGSDGGAIRRITISPSGRTAVTISDDGALRLWDLPSAHLRAALVNFEDDEYLAFSPGGAYAGSSEASGRVGWVFDHPVEAFSFEQFSLFRDKGLLLRRLAGAADDVQATLSRPPRITEVQSPQRPTATPTTKLTLHVDSTTRVDQVRAFVDGVPALDKTVCAPQADVQLTLGVPSGTSSVTVQAFDDRGQSSNPAQVTVTSTAPRSRRPNLWIVAMGVSAYPNLAPEWQLDLAAADARSMAARISAEAGDTKAYAQPAHVSLLVDADVTVPAVLAALDGLAAMAPDDLAVVFFAGHGVKPSSNADMVFLTSAASATRASLAANGIGWTQIAEHLEHARGRVVVMLDACHSGHLSQDVVVPNDSLAGELTRAHRAGVVVFAAAKGRQSSYEPRQARGLDLLAGLPFAVGSDHGYFTAAVLQSLDSPATDRDGDGEIELSEWLDEVTARVGRITRGKQTPWVTRREVFGDIRVFPAAGGGTAQDPHRAH